MSRPKKKKEPDRVAAFLRGDTLPAPPGVKEKLDVEREQAALANARERGLVDLFFFATEICGDYSLDPGFHGPVCRFLEYGISRPWPTEERHLLFSKRSDLPVMDGQLPESGPAVVAPPEGRRRYSVDLDGQFRGMYLCFRGEGRLRVILLPRGHIKSGLISEDFNLWLQVREIVLHGMPVPIALASENQGLSKGFLHGIKRKIQTNRRLQQLYPEVIPTCYLDGSSPRPKDLIWEQTAVELPGSERMFDRERSFSCFGIGTGITGRHFRLIDFDDVVSQKNIGTDLQIAKVRQSYEDSIPLLDPNEGMGIDVGTRWHFGDAHGAVLDGSLFGIDAASLCIATIDGTDDEPLYPYQDRRGRKYGFTREMIDRLQLGDAKKNIAPMSKERFSSQYRNQPLEGKDCKFPREKWRFFKLYDHTRAVKRGEVLVNRFMLCDPAIKPEPGQKTGDFAYMLALDALPSNRWRILEARRGRWTTDELLDNLAAMYQFWLPREIGIEQGQYEQTIEYAIRVRGVRINVRPITGHWTRVGKVMRCERITGLQNAGMIELPGDPDRSYKDQQWDLDEAIRMLVEESARFPKGAYDDSIDTLGYGPDVVIAPQVEDPAELPRGAPETVGDLLDRLLEEGEGAKVHPILGSER